jgi:hypothetical protein
VKPKHEYRILGLRARFAIVTRVLESWCRDHGIEWAGRDAFFDYLWELPTTEDLPGWDAGLRSDPIAGFALGDSCPADLSRGLASASLPERTGRMIFEHAFEVVYSSLYGAPDDDGSLESLQRVTQTARSQIFDAGDLRSCRFDDAHGWGYAVSEQTRDNWRRLPLSIS